MNQPMHGSDQDVNGSCYLLQCAGKKILINWDGFLELAVMIRGIRTQIGAS